MIYGPTEREENIMENERQVEQLLEEILESESTPEEVCSDCPELLALVRHRWQRIRIFQQRVGVLFPTSTAIVRHPDFSAVHLPKIPGYEIQDVLGHGGMGVVYKAWDSRLGRLVAIKMLLAGAYASNEQLERFLREVEVMASLQHPNIAQLFDVGYHEGNPYFAMEYIEGGSLSLSLSGRHQSSRQSADLVATISEAVQAAHEKGIIHCDLKTSNVLLTVDGVPKIIDFGLARSLQQDSTLTLSGVSLGTPSYMAPEQIQGKRTELGATADVYALGAILYQMLTGRPPFRAESNLETAQQVMTQDPVPPSRLYAKVPRDLEIICLKCLRKAPQQRYPSASALADDLRCFLHSEPIVARPTAPLLSLVRWVRRQPVQSMALLGNILLVITLAAWGLSTRPEHTPAVEPHVDIHRDCFRTPSLTVALVRRRLNSSLRISNSFVIRCTFPMPA